MKSLRKLFVVNALVFMLSLTALADGAMDTPKPQGQGVVDIPRMSGEMDTPTVFSNTVDPVTGAVLSLLESVLTLF